MTDTTNSANTLDTRDLTARVDELRGERDDLQTEIDDAQAERDEEGNEHDDTDAAVRVTDARNALADWIEDNKEELEGLEKFLAELAGYGGDHNWNGDSYAGHLIHDSYFETYARQYAEDMGAIDDNARWPCTCIDWAEAAKELQTDYSSAEFAGETYWYL
jgi:hypothetical protein